MSSSESESAIHHLLDEDKDKNSSEEGHDGEPKAKRRRRRSRKVEEKEKKKVPFKYETEAEKMGRIRDMVTQMMFASGDSSTPNQKNIDFVMDLVHHQLTKLLVKSYEKVISKGDTKIECVDMMFEMRHRPDIISRLLKLAKVAANVCCLGSTVGNQVPSIDAGSGGESSEDEENNDISSVNFVSHYDRLVQAVNKAEIGKSANEIEKMNDIVGRRRALRLASRTSKMHPDMYERFVQARGATLCSFNSRFFVKTVRESRSFLSWLGDPPVGSGVVFIMNFIAKETILQIVDFASRIAGDFARVEQLRAQKITPTPLTEEDRSVFHDVGVLHPSHYSTALVRCKGIKNGNDFLFGT